MFRLPPTGQHFEIREEGDWWAAVPDDEWPDEASGQRAVILSDFAPAVGDRRQEIVFIGAGMDEVGVAERPAVVIAIATCSQCPSSPVRTQWCHTMAQLCLQAAGIVEGLTGYL